MSKSFGAEEHVLRHQVFIADENPHYTIPRDMFIFIAVITREREYVSRLTIDNASRMTTTFGHSEIDASKKEGRKERARRNVSRLQE